MREWLVVEDALNPIAIATKLEQAICDRAEILKSARCYFEEEREVARAALSEFLR